MTTKELITLKLLGLGATILYGLSFLWISMMYLYGGLYYPINRSGLKKYISFEVAAVAFSALILGLIFFVAKGGTFWRILVQDFALIVFLVPSLAIILGYFENDFDRENLRLFYTGIFIMTIVIVNFNDWIQLRKSGWPKTTGDIP